MLIMKVITKLFTAAAVATGLVGAAGYGLFRGIMHRDSTLPDKVGGLFDKRDESRPVLNVEEDPRAVWFAEQSLESFTMVNNRGQKLRAHLLKAAEPSDVYVFCNHGYRNHGRGEFNLMAKFYHDKGYNVFMVDHQAAGESEGTYWGFSYYESRDGIQWLDFMKKNFGEDIQIILHGISIGGATVMLMSGNENLPDNVKFTVADCGFTSAWDEFAHNCKNAHVPTFPLLNAANFFNKHIAGFDLKDTNTKQAVAKAKVPMLFIHGGKDDFVPTTMSSQAFAYCGSAHKEFYIAPTAAHAECYPFHSEEYEARVSAFADKYIV